jgi:putative intracellular protease/amidase
MNKNEKSFQNAILLYPGLSTLDAVGPYEVLSRMPNTEIRFVGKQTGPLMTEGGVLFLGVTHTIAETPSPDMVFVPGGTTTPGQMVDDEVLDWLRRVHETTTWTASDCSGSLILAAAGILKGLPATTHWIKMGVLKSMGSKLSQTSASCEQEKLLPPLVCRMGGVAYLGQQRIAADADRRRTRRRISHLGLSVGARRRKAVVRRRSSTRPHSGREAKHAQGRPHQHLPLRRSAQNRVVLIGNAVRNSIGRWTTA